MKGWPIDVADALTSQHIDFVSRDQNQRGALTILDDTLYVPFGGHYGDPGQSGGFIIGKLTSSPHRISIGQRGPEVEAFGRRGDRIRWQFSIRLHRKYYGTTSWSDGKAVIRLSPDLHHSRETSEFFAPTDWHSLDLRDADLGGTNPLPLDVPAASGMQNLVLALGKDRKAYLLDRNNLGGIGGALVTDTVAESAMLGSPVAYHADGC